MAVRLFEEATRVMSADYVFTTDTITLSRVPDYVVVDVVSQQSGMFTIENMTITQSEFICPPLSGGFSYGITLNGNTVTFEYHDEVGLYEPTITVKAYIGQVMVDDLTLLNIANAIREKNGTEDKYSPGEMAEAILSISGGIVEVTELPTESVVGTVYKVGQPKLVDVVYYNGGYVYRGVPQSEDYRYVKTKPTENIASTNGDGSIINPYYVEDENDVFFYIDGAWVTFSSFGGRGRNYKGAITNAADATENGYYAVIGTEYVYYEYVNEIEDVIWVRSGNAIRISTTISSTAFYTIPTKTTVGVLKSNASDTAYLYYIEDENDIFMYNADWRSLSYNFGTARGNITDISDATEDGYYILRKPWKRCNT